MRFMVKDKKNNQPVANIFSGGSDIIGNLNLNSDLRLDGTIEGDLLCEAKVVIGKLGKVQGNIICNEILIEGNVIGNITVKSIIDIRSTAKIDGDINAKKLIIEEGASFNGLCNMIP